MNSNPGISTVVARAFQGTTSYPREVRRFKDFGFAIEVVAAITTDAVFKFQAAKPSDANPCVAGAFSDIPAIPTCVGENLANGELATIVIPAGTPVGTLCSVALPCRAAFVQPVAVSGTSASVQINHVLQGPMGP